MASWPAAPGSGLSAVRRVLRTGPLRGLKRGGLWPDAAERDLTLSFGSGKLGTPWVRMHWANCTVTPPSVACDRCEPEFPAPDWPGPESPAEDGVVAVAVVVVVVDALRLATDALGLLPHAVAAEDGRAEHEGEDGAPLER